MRLYHPDLGRTVEVPNSTGRVLMRSGWTDPPDVETDDHDPVEPAGSSDSDTSVSEDSNEE